MVLLWVQTWRATSPGKHQAPTTAYYHLLAQFPGNVWSIQRNLFCWTYYHWGSTGRAQALWHLLIFQVVSCPSQKNQVQATPHEQLHPMGR
jgi:hypothetical protein